MVLLWPVVVAVVRSSRIMWSICCGGALMGLVDRKVVMEDRSLVEQAERSSKR